MHYLSDKVRLKLWQENKPQAAFWDITSSSVNLQWGLSLRRSDGEKDNHHVRSRCCILGLNWHAGIIPMQMSHGLRSEEGCGISSPLTSTCSDFLSEFQTWVSGLFDYIKRFSAFIARITNQQQRIHLWEHLFTSWPQTWTYVTPGKSKNKSRFCLWAPEIRNYRYLHKAE